MGSSTTAPATRNTPCRTCLSEIRWSLHLGVTREVLDVDTVARYRLEAGDRVGIVDRAPQRRNDVGEIAVLLGRERQRQAHDEARVRGMTREAEPDPGACEQIRLQLVVAQRTVRRGQQREHGV